METQTAEAARPIAATRPDEVPALLALRCPCGEPVKLEVGQLTFYERVYIGTCQKCKNFWSVSDLGEGGGEE